MTSSFTTDYFQLLYLDVYDVIVLVYRHECTKKYYISFC